MMDIRIDCPCAPRADQPRHPDGDTVTLRDTLDFRAALTLRNAFIIGGAATLAERLTIAFEWYLRLGIERWTLLDDRGKPLPVTWPNIESVLLADVGTALALDTATDGLYAKKVVLPLVQQASRSLPGTPTAPSTSQPKGSPTRSPKRSRPSSTSTSPTDGTAATSTSLDGVSSSSQNSVSAA